MVVELPEDLEAALKAQAKSLGISPAVYLRDVLLRDLAVPLEPRRSAVPFKSSRGILAKYGTAPSAEEIDANRAEMFLGFGDGLN